MVRTEGWARTCLGEEDHFELGNMPVLDLIPFRLISSQCPALFYTTVVYCDLSRSQSTGFYLS